MLIESATPCHAQVVGSYLVSSTLRLTVLVGGLYHCAITLLTPFLGQFQRNFRKVDVVYVFSAHKTQENLQKSINSCIS